MSENLVDILSEGANEHSALARVLRHVEDRHVCPHARDFYVALKYDPTVVVRLRAEMPAERELPIDCRYRNGAVEFTTEFRDVGITGTRQFVEDVREADGIEVVHHHDSQFGTGEGWTCYNCDGEFFDPESKFVEATNEVRVTCPDCGAVDEIPQGTEPPRSREEVA